jgi:hypothetical protein
MDILKENQCKVALFGAVADSSGAGWTGYT